MTMTQPMTVSPANLEKYIHTLLNANAFHDYCPNGLQVDGGQDIHRIVTGVTACEALIDAAIEYRAQAILVHHGYFWKGEPAVLTGMKGTRIRKLMQHGISLLAYHLPLDAHPTLGNNAQLAHVLGLTLSAPLYPEEKNPVGNIAILDKPLSANALYQRLSITLQREPLYIQGNQSFAQNAPPDDKHYHKIGICTGGAQDMLEQAHSQGCDVFISGEISERTTHIARELGIDYFAAGHHATEKGGIRALGEALGQGLTPLMLNKSLIMTNHLSRPLGNDGNFKLDIKFVDIPNPV